MCTLNTPTEYPIHKYTLLHKHLLYAKVIENFIADYSSILYMYRYYRYVAKWLWSLDIYYLSISTWGSVGDGSSMFFMTGM